MFLRRSLKTRRVVVARMASGGHVFTTHQTLRSTSIAAVTTNGIPQRHSPRPGPADGLPRALSMRAVVRSFLFIVVTGVLLLMSVPAAAQCVQPGTTDCDPPDVAITPDSGVHTVPVNTSKAVTVKVSFSDPDGLRHETLKITLRTSTQTNTLTGFSWTPNPEGTFALAQGVVNLKTAGENVLTAEIADGPGHVGSATATFDVIVDDPNAGPVVSLAPHHDGYRLTSLGAAVLEYALPAYASMDTPRSIGLYYNSQHANPTGLVQLDVDTGTAPDGSQAAAVSLQIFAAVGENDALGAQITSETFWTKEPEGKQRVGAQWNMRDKPTGAYRYVARVRAYRTNRTMIGEKLTPFRVLVVNNIHSRYGTGWNPTVQRLYPVNDGKVNGVMIHEGGEIVRFWERGSCSTCDYKSSAGDFSRITYRTQPARWERTYTDGTILTFNPEGLLVTAADGFGRTTWFTWSLVPDTPRPPAPLLLSITDPVSKGWYTEYVNGFLAAIIDPINRRADFTYQSGTGNLLRADGPVTLAGMQYDSSSRVTSYRDAAGTWNITYGGAGTVYRVRSPVVRADGADVRLDTTYRSLQGLTVPESGTSLAGSWAPPVPADEVFIAETDPLEHTTRFALDRYGNITKVIDNLNRSRVNFYNENGLPELVSNGVQEIAYAWSSRGHLLAQTVNGTLVYSASYVGDELEYEMTGGEGRWYSYGPRGELTRSWTGTREDSFRTGTTYEYNANYFMIAANGPAGERTEWSYDNSWQNVSQVSHVREDGVRLTQSFTYDSAGRIHVATNALGQTITTTWDALNRQVTVTDMMQRSVRYTYSGPHLTGVTDQSNKTYGYAYNALGWLVSERFPEDNTSRSYSYNKDGQVLSVTNRVGQTVMSTYDNAHRLLTRIADGVTTTVEYVDEKTVLLTNNETKMTIARHPHVGGLELVRATLGGPQGIRHYEIGTVYDQDAGWAAKGIDVRLYQNGSLLRPPESIRYTYDPRPIDTTLGSAISIQDLSGRTTTLGYDPSGRHVRTTFPNGVTQYNWYFKEGDLSGRTFSTSALNQELGANYAYDHLGRLTERTSVSMNTRWAYEYDYQGQLTAYSNQQKGTPPGCDPSQSDCDPIWLPGPYETYAYDAVGNRTDSGAALIPGSNRYRTFDGYGVVSGGNAGMTYDAEGNLTRKYKPGFEQQLTWNALGQLASVTTNGVTVTYGYSPTGRRVRRTQGGQTTYYIYHNDELLMELDGNGNPINGYTHMPGIDMPLSVKVGGDSSFAYYYTMEQPGHVSALLNTNGGIAARLKYAPFGRIESSTGSVSQSLKFMARELDATTGLYYVRARWYDPSLARFISSDPIGLAGGINTYAYVGNAPMDARDPSGLQTHSCPGGVPCTMPPVDICSNPFIAPGAPCRARIPFQDNDRLRFYRDQAREQDAWVPGRTAVDPTPQRDAREAARRAPRGPARPDVGPAGQAAAARADQRMLEARIRECQARVLESSGGLFAGSLAVLSGGHTGISSWNNMNRPPFLGADASPAARASADNMQRRQITGDVAKRFYAGMIGFMAGVAMGTGISLELCEHSSYYRSPDILP